MNTIVEDLTDIHHSTGRCRTGSPVTRGTRANCCTSRIAARLSGLARICASGFHLSNLQTSRVGLTRFVRNLDLSASRKDAADQNALPPTIHRCELFVTSPANA